MIKNLKLLSYILIVSIYSSKAFASKTIEFLFYTFNMNSISFSPETLVTADGKNQNVSKNVSTKYDDGTLTVKVTFDETSSGNDSLATTFSNSNGSGLMQVSRKSSEEQSTQVPNLDFYVTGTLYLNGYAFTGFTLAHNNKSDESGPEDWWIAQSNATRFYDGANLQLWGGYSSYFCFTQQTKTNYEVEVTDIGCAG